MTLPTDPLRVLVSYSHDSPEHAAKARKLADTLRAHGIEAWIDQYLPEMGPDEGWRAWMQRQVEYSDWVLMVCTPTYHRRINKEESPGKGHGATFEGHLLLQLMYEAGSRRTKLVPVLFDDAKPSEAIPLPLRDFTHFRLPGEFDQLARALALRDGMAPQVAAAMQVPEAAARPTLTDDWVSLGRGERIESNRIPRSLGEPASGAEAARVKRHSPHGGRCEPWFRKLPLDWADPETREAEAIFIQAYSTNEELLTVAAYAGVPKTALRQQANVEYLVRQVFDAARGADRLERLLDELLDDVSRSAYAAKLRPLVEPRKA